MSSIRSHVIEFANGEEKARWLGHVAILDSEKRSIASLALQIAGSASSDYDAIERVFAWVQRKIAYVRDPGWREQFADSETIIRRGFDDCDGKARVLVALLTALARDVYARRHIEAVIDAVFRDRDFDHVQVLARGDGTIDHPLADAHGWLLLDPTLDGVKVGEGSEHARIDSYTRDVATI